MLTTNSVQSADLQIPKRISPCPIIEGIVELRFTSDLPSDAIFGVIYSKFQDLYPVLEKLPILQLPESIRLQDPNLQFQPHYKMVSGNFILQIGPRVISIVNTEEYVGWVEFSQRIKSTFQNLQELNLFSTAERIGIRYINFFDTDVFPLTNLDITLSGKPYQAEQMTFRSIVRNGNIQSTIQILNAISLSTQSKQKMFGSTIDIDTFTQEKSLLEITRLSTTLDQIHTEEKRNFFLLLNDSYLARLNPEY